MDELTLLQACRPDPAPPSVDERARMEDALTAFLHDDDHIAPDGSTPDPAEPTITPIDRRRHPRRRALAFIAVAATIVVALGVVTVVRQSGEVVQIGPEATTTTTPDSTSSTSTLPADPAAALRVIADALDRAPTPPMPYRVSTVGDAPPSLAGLGITSYVFEGDLTIRVAGPCPQLGDGSGGGVGGIECTLFMPTGMGPAEIASTTTATEARAILERWITEQANATGTGTPPAIDDPRFRVEQLDLLLQVVFPLPWTPAPLRAELLRMMADTPGLARQPDATNSFGQVGASFSLTGSSTFILTLDPSDGTLLRAADRKQEPRTAGIFGEDWTTSYERPSSDVVVPPAVDQLHRDVVSHGAELRNMGAGARCMQAEARTANDIFGPVSLIPAIGSTLPPAKPLSLPFTVPPDLGFRLCW